MIHIFGYGSLMFPKGINGRGMDYEYSWEDLIPTKLRGYKRGLFAAWGNWRFYGVKKEPDSFINGTLLPIFDSNDLQAFAESENLGESYLLEDISEQFPDLKEVYTLVVPREEDLSLPVYPEYVGNCWRGLQHWGKEFAETFLATGGLKS